MDVSVSISPADIIKLFRLKEKSQGPMSLSHAEEKGYIPTAARIQKGKQQVRNWSAEDLPAIGRRFGFMGNPKEQHIISVFTSKGGVLKSTISFSLARTLALNGIKTLVIGLDTQMSMNSLILGERVAETLEDIEYPMGLWELITGEADLSQVVQHSDISTLDILPENPDLASLTKRLNQETRREDFFTDSLVPLLKEYQVVIFDNPPNWNNLIESALVASNHVISPAACNLGGYHTFLTNLEYITDFQTKAKVSWDTFSIIPTLKDKNKLSEQIYGFYLTTKPKEICPAIRVAVAGQEALFKRQTIFEYAPNSLLADDYYDLLTNLWSRIIASEAVHGS